MTNINRTELNRAIFEVINNKFKKDCPTAHALVKAAGYDVEKWDGDWHVRNSETNRCIYLVERGSYYHPRKMIQFNYLRNPVEITNKFDFVGCLDKPVNQYMKEQQDIKYWGEESKSKKQYEMLKEKKRSLRYHYRSILEAKSALAKAIEKYEKEIAWHKDYVEKSRVDLANYRKEIGLA